VNSTPTARKSTTTATKSKTRRRIHGLVLLVALFGTAFSSLVYELVWSRELSYIFGSTALAASSVLAVFMAGLAAGSFYGARLLEARRDRLRYLALLQCAIGVTCVLTLSTIGAVHRFQSHLLSLAGGEATYGVQIALFCLTSLVLIVPTFLIGAAFPAIVQLYHASGTLVGQSVGRCYWVDTLGAALGMSLAAFFLVPTMGLLKTSLVASSLNFACGLLVFVALRPADARAEEPRRVEADEPAARRGSAETTIVYFLFFLSGFAALLLEVLWIRHVGLTYGSGLHAFAIVVVTFLLGLSLGSALYEVAFKRIRNQVVLFCAIELGIGATGLLVTAAFPHMELVFLKVYFGVDSYFAFVATLSLICFALLLLPTILMGITLPALCAVTASGRRLGEDFGRLYAVNSLGALSGSFCAGFVIIPALGIYRSSVVAAAIYTFIAFAFLFCFADRRALRRRAAVVFGLILLAAAAVFARVHDPDHLYNGAFYSGIGYSQENYQQFLEEQKGLAPFMRFLKTGIYGQVAAYGAGGNMILSSNGRIDSSTLSNTRSYQLMLGHIPLMIHRQPSSVLNIGLGAGWTVSAMAENPGTRSVDCVEINPLIVDVTQSIFHAYNNDVLNHDKVTIYVNDGRNFVAQTGKQYDVIVSEPPEFWFSGVSALFTTEFYTRAKQILTADGLFCQWFPRYELAEQDYKIALNSIKHVFPYAYEFNMSSITGDTHYESFLVVASKLPLDIPARLAERETQMLEEDSDTARMYLRLIEMIKNAVGRNNEDLEAYIENVDQLHTDDFPILEFHAARDRFRKFRDE